MATSMEDRARVCRRDRLRLVHRGNRVGSDQERCVGRRRHLVMVNYRPAVENPPSLYPRPLSGAAKSPEKEAAICDREQVAILDHSC